MILNFEILNYTFVNLILYFSIYSFLGWCLETVFATIKNKQFTNRGFLYGPICPMYGFTAVVIILFSNFIGTSYLNLYIICFLGASVVEYITGFVLEELFHAKWWDYSNQPFNLKGRICILFSLIWGLVGVLLIKVLHPLVSHLVTNLASINVSSILFYILIIYFTIDFTITLTKLLELKNLFLQLENISYEIKTTLTNLRVIAHDKVVLSKDKIVEADIFSRDFWNKREVIDNIPKELKEKYDIIIDRIASRYSRIFIAFPHLNSKRLKKSFTDIRDKIENKVTVIEVPHFLKIFNYMYHLNKRNFKAYSKPVLNPKKEAITNNSIHWVGHATTIINLEGKIIVTDPVLGNLGFIKRLVHPSIDLKELKIDYLLLTHCHMDHLNYTALKAINKNVPVIIPRGMKNRLKLRGFKNVVVLKPGESYKDSFLKVESIKAEHKGNRYPGIGFKDCNSYLISGKEKVVLFSGDTAYTTAYAGIKSDVAIMPVGCYKPDDFLTLHCSPEQSFHMFKMMDCKLMIPIHYKTYILAQDDDLETVATLERINDGSMKIIDIGETVAIDSILNENDC